MPEQICDFLERATTSKHPGCEAMAEDVYARIRQAAASVCLEESAFDDTWQQRLLHGGNMAYKHPPTLARRPFVSEVVGHRLTHQNRHRQPVDAPGLAAAKADRSVVPVQIFELESDHFGRSQTEPGKRRAGYAGSRPSAPSGGLLRAWVRWLARCVATCVTADR